MRLLALRIATLVVVGLAFFSGREAQAQTCTSPGACGGQAPSGCFCDNRCLQPNFQDCCSDVLTACQVPVFSSLSPNAGSTTGGYTTNITGNHFDSSNTLGTSVVTSVTLGGSVCPVGARTTTSISCTVPAGIGMNNAVTIENTWTTYLGTQVLSVTSPNASTHFNYNPPQLGSPSPSSMPTTGGTLTLSGTNLGATGATVTVAGAPCPLISQAHTEVRCTMAAGVGTNRAIVLTVGGQVSNTVNINYQAPSISGFAGSHATAGGTPLTVNGANFGPSGAALTITVGGNPCPVTGHNHVQATCTLPPGQGTVNVIATVGGQSSPPALFVYDSPDITSVAPAILPTAGGATTITGVNFGVIGTVTIGGVACPVTSYGQTQIVCTAPAGIGTGLTLTLTSGGQSDSTTVSYAPPALSAVAAPTRPTQGGSTVTITGTNLGATGATVTIGGAACPVTLQGHTQVRCTLPVGQGTAQPVVLTVGGQVSNTLFLSYDPPVITGLAPASGPTSGGSLTIDGANFGAMGIFDATVTVGGVSCPVTSATHTTIVCTAPPGVGVDLPVIVTLAGQSSAPALFDHLPPAITSIAPDNGPMAGGVVLTLTGTNFGAAGATVTVAGNACPVLSQSHTSATCTLPAGTGKNLPVVLTVGGQSSSAALFDYDAPEIAASPSPLAFGEVLIGGAGSDATLTLSNAGAIDLHVSSLVISGAAAADYTIVSPPLPITVVPGGTRAVVVHFQPPAHGLRSASLTLQSDAFTQPTLVVALSGTGVAPIMSATPSVAFGARNVGASVTGLVSVNNTGERSLTVSQVSLSGGDAADFTVLTALPINVAAGASASLTLRFAPAAVGARAATASIVGNDPLTPVVSVALSGTGTSPGIAIAPTSIDFGDVRIDETSPLVPVTVSNTGSGPLTITGVSLGGTGNADFTVSAVTLPLVLAPGGDLVDNVAYAPSAGGADVATLQITSDDPTATSLEVPLDGNGVSPVLSLTPTSLDFGGHLVGRASAPRTITITNDGTSALSITSLAFTGIDAAAYTISVPPTLPAQIAPAQALVLGLVFTPAAVGGTSATLAIGTDDPAAPTADVSLVGLGLSQVLAVSPLAIDFGVIEAPGDGVDVSLQVTNTSSDPVTLLDGTLGGGSASVFSVASLAGVLAPGASRTVAVGFTAASAGDFTAELTIAAAESGVPAVVVPLTAKAVSSLLAVSPESLDFGALVVGETSSSMAVTVTNQSGGSVTVASLSVVDPAFTISGAATPITVVAGDSFTFEVSFTAGAVGVVTSAVQIFLDGQVTAEAVVAVSGEGTAMPGADAGPDAGGENDAGGAADAGPGSPDAGLGTSGGGCGCSVGGRSPATSWLFGAGLLFGVVLLGVRRRRR